MTGKKIVKFPKTRIATLDVGSIGVRKHHVAAFLEAISQEINQAVEKVLENSEIVVNRKATRLESVYYYLPGFFRRIFWKVMLKRPRFAFSKMGNVSVTSIGMVGKSKGWFLPFSIHPVCFGIGRIVKKPTVVSDEIKIREIINLTVLIDHDVIDGVRMARFCSELTERIEKGFMV